MIQTVHFLLRLLGQGHHAVIRESPHEQHWDGIERLSHNKLYRL